MNQIRIAAFKAEYINLEQKEFEKSDFTLALETGFSENDLKSFRIKFRAVISSEAGYELTIEYSSFFETEEDIIDSFKTSNFVTINAPAIAYPFLRSFISTITLNAGYEPILIPTINFQALAQKNHPSSIQNQ
ncbi:MAG: protein-export chaperone SecB [Methylomonas sp.]|nr:protein-export chaperone SecB [Methylomonas sp.]